MAEETEPKDPGHWLIPHLNAAYNLARWLTGNTHDAEDVLQESCVRALRSFKGFRGGDSRAWLLKIVRNTCYTWLRNRAQRPTVAFDEELHRDERDASQSSNWLLQRADRELLERALAELPVKLREMLVLRELEGLSYREIADVADIPIGTVMSGLSRGRARLRQSIAAHLQARSPQGRVTVPRQ